MLATEFFDNEVGKNHLLPNRLPVILNRGLQSRIGFGGIQKGVDESLLVLSSKIQDMFLLNNTVRRIRRGLNEEVR